MKIEWPNQFAHLLFSVSVLLGRVVWFPKNFLGTALVFAGLIAWALVKELVFDLNVTKSQDVDSAWLDVAFYLAGAGITLLVLSVTGKV